MKRKAWDGVIDAPVTSRSLKPRTTGLTMVIDKGLGLNQVEDLITTAGDYLDVITLTFGTSAFYDFDLLNQKLHLLRQAEMKVMPGGTFLEVAVWRNSLEAYRDRAQERGFSAVEVSDGTIDIPLSERQKVIRRCLERGFLVISEVGKKDPRQAPPLEALIEQAREDKGI